jgi:hypothetical protein
LHIAFPKVPIPQIKSADPTVGKLDDPSPISHSSLTQTRSSELALIVHSNALFSALVWPAVLLQLLLLSILLQMLGSIRCICILGLQVVLYDTGKIHPLSLQCSRCSALISFEKARYVILSLWVWLFFVFHSFVFVRAFKMTLFVFQGGLVKM